MKKSKSNKDYKIISMQNGLKAFIYPKREIHSVSILAIIRAGHLCESLEQNGIAHLLEHMLFEGTKKFQDNISLSNFFDEIAGEFTGTTSYDYISIGGTFVDSELQNALLSLEQLLFQPLLKEEFLIKERSIITDELQTLEDNFDYQNFIDTKKNRFVGKTILREPIGGTIKSLEKIKIQDVLNFHKKFFSPSNMIFIITGNFDFQNVTQILNKIFSYYPNKGLKHQIFKFSQFSNKVIFTRKAASQKSYIRITFPSFSWEDKIEDRVALSYICSLFTNRRDSLLYSKLREEKGLIYDIYSDFQSSFDIGVYEIYTSTPNDKSLFVIEEILKAMQHIKLNEFDKSYFEKIKEIDKKRLKMALDTDEGILKWFSEEMFYRYPVILKPNDMIPIYDNISTNDLLRVARKILDISKININVLQEFSSKKEEKGFNDKLKKLLSF